MFWFASAKYSAFTWSPILSSIKFTSIKIFQTPWNKLCSWFEVCRIASLLPQISKYLSYCWLNESFLSKRVTPLLLLSVSHNFVKRRVAFIFFKFSFPLLQNYFNFNIYFLIYIIIYYMYYIYYILYILTYVNIYLIIYIYIFNIYLYFYITHLYILYIYTNFDCPLYNCQIYINNSRRHFIYFI